jgi:glycosyltransferase involved in cell wall biosynthesis
MVEDPQMRILFLLRNAEGGIRTHVVTLMRGALEHGHDALLITDLKQADGGFHKILETEPEIRKRVVSIPMKSAPGPWDLMTLWLLYVGLRSARSQDSANAVEFDAVHGHGAKGGLFARLCRALGILPKSTRVLYTPHGGSLHAMHGWLFNRIYVFIERWLARYTDLVLCESRYTMEQFESRVGRGLAPIRLNRNGIDPILPVLDAWPEGLGRSVPVKIKAFGLLREIKGFDVLIQAAHFLRQRGLKAEIEISGEGKARDVLAKLVSDLKLHPGDEAGAAGSGLAGSSVTIEIHHETSNALHEMREAHIVVQPSRFESFGLVSLEAQATGCFVIASRVGGLIDVVDHQNTGLLVEPSDPDALANTIEWALNHPEEAQLIRARAVKRASTEFSSENMIEGALKAYAARSENPLD